MTDFADFINLKPGQRLIYYTGEIGHDSRKNDKQGEIARIALRLSCEAVKTGLVTLHVQRVDWKNVDLGCHYVAVGRRPEPPESKRRRPKKPPENGGNGLHPLGDTALMRSEPRQIPEEMFGAPRF